LQPGEEVLVDTRPRVVRLLRPLLLVLIVLGGSIAVVAVWAAAPIWFGWVLLGLIVVALLGLAVRAGQWWAETLTVTSRRVVYRAGLLRRLGREIPIANVQSVTYRQSLLQRVVRTGDLLVESAGEASREPFPDVPDPAWVQTQVTAAMARSRGVADGSGSRLGPANGAAPAFDDEDPHWQDQHWQDRHWEARHAAAEQWRVTRGGLYDQGEDQGARGGGAGASREVYDPPDTDPTPAIHWEEGDRAPVAGPAPASGQAAPGGDVVAQIERLAGLYERGVLTREEFEAKKAELLARL
jgi:membrane protein YdbS with pleckstrin-like domain